MLRAVLVFAAAMALAGATATDQCNKYPSCQTCVANPLCGWCSEKVTYQSGARGFHCAGWNNNKSNPFVCNGIYSTNTCQQGYYCNTTTYTCNLTAPGGGEPLPQCQANCSTVGKTYLCDNTTHTCKQAPPGQGTSFPLCEAQCAATHSASPHSHSPASHSPASPSPNSPAPGPTPAPTYACNTTTFQCNETTAGHGSSLPVCQANCKPSNHTPASLVGLWRAFEVQNTAKIEEIDLDFTTDGKVKIFAGISNNTYSCDVEKVGDNGGVWFTNCNGMSNETLKCFYETSNTLPETYEELLACSMNGTAPTSIISSMNAPATFVLFMSRCVPDGYCSFHFGREATSPHGRRRTAGVSLSNLFMREKKPVAKQLGNATDPCRQYGQNCATCLTHQYCGWCSTNVTYMGGVEGTQCAGVNPDPNKHVPFVCEGQYSTEMCLPGWECNVANQTCVPSAPGNGVPKADCEAECKAKPGPPSLTSGHYRGLMINKNYTFGEVTATISQSGNATFKIDGRPLFTATVEHQAANMILKITSGLHSGRTMLGIFSATNNEILSYMALAFGVIEPTNYKQGMTPPDEEYILAKCGSPACTW